MAIRFPSKPICCLSFLLLVQVAGGCAQHGVLFESRRDPISGDAYGGKVSMEVRAEPVATDRHGPVTGPVGSSMPPSSAVVPVSPSSSAVLTGRASADSMPVFFSAPGQIEPSAVAPVVGTEFVSSAATDGMIFASHRLDRSLGPIHSAPAAVDFSVPSSDESARPVASASAALPGGGGFFTPNSPGWRLEELWIEAKQNVASDYRHYYDLETMTELACGLMLGGMLANTSMDQELRDWYQDDVRSDETDHFADFWNALGAGHIFIPSYACLAVASKLLDDIPLFELTGDFSGRVTRAYLVGAPPMLFMQFALGASRPGEADHGSYWDFFEDMNSVSGHAFVGAVPLITAAHMTDSVVLKGGFYACSTLTGLARFNNDDHYLSQVILGWWMAYLACEAIEQTEMGRHGLAVMPVASREMVGLEAIWKY